MENGVLGVDAGCKVAFHYYSTEAFAKEASKRAISKGYDRAAEGFDFGYCVPGEINKMNHKEYGELASCFPPKNSLKNT